MIDDNYDEELPPILVNVGSHNASNFTMPPADVLATQRAREEQCELELRLLREMHVLEEPEAARAAHAQCSDSSGSGGESTLTAAVDGLRMLPSKTSAAFSVDMIQVIRELLEYLPKSHSQFMYDYLEVLQKGNSAMIQFVNHELLLGMESALQSEHSQWEPGAVLCCGAWLCARCAGGAGGAGGAGEACGVSGLRLRRALHALLTHAEDDLVEELARVLSAAVRAPTALLELSDAAQGAPGRPARLARALLRRGLDEEKGCSYTRVQLAGRAAAWAGGAPPDPLPAAATATTSASTLTHTEQLKVAVGAAKLQLLLRDRN